MLTQFKVILFYSLTASVNLSAFIDTNKKQYAISTLIFSNIPTERSFSLVICSTEQLSHHAYTNTSGRHGTSKEYGFSTHNIMYNCSSLLSSQSGPYILHTFYNNHVTHQEEVRTRNTTYKRNPQIDQSEKNGNNNYSTIFQQIYSLPYLILIYASISIEETA